MTALRLGAIVLALMLSTALHASDIPAPQPRIANGAWAAHLNGHPRLYGTAAMLKARATEQPQPYKRFQRESDRPFAALVHTVDGLPPEKVRPFVDAALKHIARGPTNVHQDSWIWLDDVALTFDAFHDQIPPTERARMIEWMNAHLESFTSDEGAFHNSTFPKIRTYLRIAYATWNENPKAKAFRDHAIVKLYEGRVVPVLRRFGAGGGHTEGGWYARLALWSLVEGLELARRFEGYDGFAQAPQFFYQRLAFEIHEPMPGLWTYGCERYGHEGDGSILYGGNLEFPRHTRTVLAQYFRGSELARFTAAKRRRGSNAQAALTDFLYDEPPDAPADLKTFPLAHIATGVGRVYARSDWGDDATWFRFDCGPYFTGHQHFDAGNFEIVRHEPLATESGAYDDYISSHSVNWYTRTIAHNCVLVHMPGEQWKDLRFPGPYGNDGGQAKKWRWGWQTLEQWDREWPAQDRGRIVAYDNRPEALYVAADCTPAYAKEKLSLWTRQIIFLRPSTFVIFDRVISTNPAYAKTWLLHSANAPRIDGRAATIADGKGQLIVQTILPRDAKLTAAEGYAYDGKSYEPLPNARTKGAVRHRLEVRPSLPATEDFFLHVLSTSGPVEVELVNASDATAVRVGDAAVHFTGPVGATVLRNGAKTPLRSELFLSQWEK